MASNNEYEQKQFFDAGIKFNYDEFILKSQKLFIDSKLNKISKNIEDAVNKIIPIHRSNK